MSEPPPPAPAPPGVPPPVPARRLRDDVPDAGPPPKKGLSTLAIVLIVVGVLGVAGIAVVVGILAVVVPSMQHKQMRFQCQQHLSQVAQLIVADRADRTPVRYGGPAYLLEWRKSGRFIRAGQEAVLLCPADAGAAPLARRELWDAVDLANPAPGLCSYAVRDFVNFPLDERSAAPQPIAACLHHTEGPRDRGGAIVAFDDGSTRFVGYEELGISDASELTVGPDAPAELLRALTFESSETR